MSGDEQPIIPKEYYDQLCRMGKENLCEGKYVEGMGYILPEVVVTPIKVGNYETFYNLDISNTIVVKNSPDTIPFFVFESKYQTVYNHHVNAITKKGKPTYLRYDSNGKNKISRRRKATSKYPTIPGYHRDEYPYACTMEGGAGASVEHVLIGDNINHGSDLGVLVQNFNMKTGDVFHIILVPDNSKKQREPVREPVFSPVPEKERIPSLPVMPAPSPVKTKEILTWGSVLTAIAMFGYKALDVISSRFIIIIMPLDPSFYQQQYPMDENGLGPIA